MLSKSSEANWGRPGEITFEVHITRWQYKNAMKQQMAIHKTTGMDSENFWYTEEEKTVIQ